MWYWNSDIETVELKKKKKIKKIAICEKYSRYECSRVQY